MQFKFRFAFLLLFITLNVYAGNVIGFRLDIEAPSHKDKIAYLLTYRSGEIYLLDSCKIDHKGRASIVFDKMVPSGEYSFHVKPDTEIPLLIDHGQDHIKLHIGKDKECNKISGSLDTQILWQYLDWLNKYDKEQSELLGKYQLSADKSQLKSLLDESDMMFAAKVQRLIDNNKGTWGSVYLCGLQPVSLPYEKPHNAEERKIDEQYMRQHYFDQIDMNDVRLLRTNYLYSYIDNYQSNWVSQNPDSLAESAVRIVGMARKNPVFMQQLLAYFINNSYNSSQMGMENVWARLIEEYVFDNERVKIDSLQLMILSSKYEAIKYNRIGMKAHDLPLETIGCEKFNLYDVDAEYIILCFYDPECAHCRKEIEDLRNVTDSQFKNRNLKIIAVNIFPQKEQWQQFVEHFKIEEWVNCADPEYNSSFWLYYNTSSVPALYVLDKNKRIIAKDSGGQNLEHLFKWIFKD